MDISVKTGVVVCNWWEVRVKRAVWAVRRVDGVGGFRVDRGRVVCV